MNRKYVDISKHNRLVWRVAAMLLVIDFLLLLALS